MKKTKIEDLVYTFDFDLEVGPPDPKNFWGEALAIVLVDGEAGVIDYRIYIGTPISLVSNFSDIQDHIRAFTEKSPHCVFGKGLLLVDEYNIDVIESAIREEAHHLEYYAFDVS